VTDALGDFRPDFIYDLVVSFATAQAQALLSPTRPDFGNQYLNTTNAPVAVTLANIGGTSLTISNSSQVTITDANASDYSIASGSTCVVSSALVVNPGGSCVVNVTFRPSAPGPRVASLSIATTAPGSPHLVPLGGGGADFTIQPDLGSSAATVNAGQSANFSLSFSPVSGSSPNPSAITFAISGLPTGASGAFSPASVPAASLPATIALVVTTTQRSVTLPPAPHRLPMPPISLFVFFGAAAVLAMWALMLERMHAIRWVRACAMLAVVGLFATLGACSGGGGGGGGSGSAGTPAGTSTLTVMATSGPVTRTTTVTLTVQ
jgi:hypothetical protein